MPSRMEVLFIACLFSYLYGLDSFSTISSFKFGQRAIHSESQLLSTKATSRGNVLNMALANSASLMVRKGKMKEVQLLVANITATGETHPINTYLKNGTRPFGVGTPIDFFTSTASRFQSISVLPEFSKKAKTGFVLELPPPEILGGVLRDAGSRGIFYIIIFLHHKFFSEFSAF
jgi:hypothetical protein